jgi:hypothetical protein
LGIDGNPIGKGSPYIDPIAPTAICLHECDRSHRANGTATVTASARVFLLVQLK